MTTTSSDTAPRSLRWLSVLIACALILLVVYVLALGPAVWLVEHGWVSDHVISFLYYPLGWLSEHGMPEWLIHTLEWYESLWSG